ncbi:MAG: DedA family protein [Cyanobacteriota bacterium]|nr:DedA family protein [Cyanobacteriota bacterium]
MHDLALINLEGAVDQALLQDLLQRWGYGVIFVAMLLENAGVPLPGETVTLLGGYAAGSGQLNVWGVMAAAATGAILGDNVGYWVGRRAGWGLILRVGRLLRQSPEQLERLREQFLRHANASVLLGRFVAVLRVVAGPMAGAVGMSYRRFVVCNSLGAILWAGSMVSLAWLGGRWIPFSQMVGGVIDFGLGALALVTVIVLLPKLLSTLERRQLERQAPPARSDDPTVPTADDSPALAPRPTGPLSP